MTPRVKKNLRIVVAKTETAIIKHRVLQSLYPHPHMNVRGLYWSREHNYPFVYPIPEREQEHELSQLQQRSLLRGSARA